eukprot:CAMPEP_0119299086 /NCGR_PEP_ID=MMETSP1333-20130426/1192_1 /TAXON_ID=418940 /ORGANISM="Scyphosphaera apsteinii, Strain RCC1455" /LENGTH=182 /DNA_ID=CAMNT_0007300385 /DNA_START=123 /DNA_END=671 /DNA_ORIENTATION=+
MPEVVMPAFFSGICVETVNSAWTAEFGPDECTYTFGHDHTSASGSTGLASGTYAGTDYCPTPILSTTKAVISCEDSGPMLSAVVGDTVEGFIVGKLAFTCAYVTKAKGNSTIVTDTLYPLEGLEIKDFDPATDFKKLAEEMCPETRKDALEKAEAAPEDWVFFLGAVDCSGPGSGQEYCFEK